jgi:hypothetical protein
MGQVRGADGGRDLQVVIGDSRTPAPRTLGITP